MTVIRTNPTAANILRSIDIVLKQGASATEKLSSGLRINRSADDPAGLELSVRMQAKVTSLGQAARNTQDAVNMLQATEGGLSQVHSILQRVRTLAVQAGNDSNGSEGRKAIKVEADQLGQELVRMAAAVTYNGIGLLDGNSLLSFQAGEGDQRVADTIEVDLRPVDTSVFGAAIMALDFGTPAGALGAISTLDESIKATSMLRSHVGAAQNRMESTLRHLNITKENISAASSTISDAVIADEMSKSLKSKIVAEAGMSVLSQATQRPQDVLRLIG